MKYIRTKDGIYEPTKWQCDLSGEMILVKANNKFGNDKVFARDIVKQANTIEELCDVFVYKKELYNKIEIGKDLENKTRIRLFGISFFDLYIEEWEDIYGAIWTDKGLIYVAKINSKGELELL